MAQARDGEEVDLLVAVAVEASQKTGNERWNIPRILRWSCCTGARAVARLEKGWASVAGLGFSVALALAALGARLGLIPEAAIHPRLPDFRPPPSPSPSPSCSCSHSHIRTRAHTHAPTHTHTHTPARAQHPGGGAGAHCECEGQRAGRPASQPARQPARPPHTLPRHPSRGCESFPRPQHRQPTTQTSRGAETWKAKCSRALASTHDGS